MELVLEQTQQSTSHEVSVSTKGVEELKRKVKIKGEKKEALLTLRQKLARNPVKEILLKLNLPDHRSILTDSKIHSKMVMEANLIPDDAEILIHPLHDHLTEVDDPPKLHTSYNTLLVHLQATTNILIKKVFNDVHKKHIEVEEAFKNTRTRLRILT
ncbi:hypothetical protein Tco_0157657 [Tanacetum coccineum]